MITKWWLIVKKQEMTRIWADNKMIPVTLLKIADQTVLRHKTVEKDGYTAIVVWADQKRTGRYAYSCEYKVSEEDLATYAVGTKLTGDVVAELETVRVEGISKWKWFQGWMKRFNFGWWPATHGSKFHRALWSTGNRKPRRTHKGKKMAGHMWSEKLTLKSVWVIELFNDDTGSFVVLKGSVPGAYNGYLKLIVA